MMMAACLMGTSKNTLDIQLGFEQEQNYTGGRNVEQLDFGFEGRCAQLDSKKDPLVRINAIIPWEIFRPRLKLVWREPERKRKSPAGRKPWDEVVMFKAIVLCALYNLSDDQVEYQILDRLSFTRFLGLSLTDRVPDAKTVWMYRDKLARAGVIEELFADFDDYLGRRGYKAMGGQIIDASIVSVPRQRNTRDENKKIKKGEVPGEWKQNPSKGAQKDTDARWTKKRGTSYYGYKNHVNVDAHHKFIRDYGITDASVHDSRVFEGILDERNSGNGVWADSAYRSAETERKLREKGYRSHVHRKGSRNKPLGKWAKLANRIYSGIRVRVEHVFGAQSNDMGGRLLRSVGIKRAKANIGLKNLAYNMRRLVYLEGAAG